MRVSRRRWLQLGGALALGPARSAKAASDLPRPIAALKPMIAGVGPITLAERKARLARAQRLMKDEGLDAVVVAGGTSLEYFTGAQWRNSERFFGLVLAREGDPAWVTPAFEKRRAEEQVKIGADVRAWEEHESPYALVASILEDRGALTGRIGIEESMPFAFAHEIGLAAPAARLASATAVTAGCRMVKDAHEIEILRRACEITVRAHRAVFASLRPGMTQGDAAGLCREAHRRLGVEGGALALFGADAAFPHGTSHPRPLAAGDVVLLDGGGKLHGYESDITRTMVFGAAPTARQRTLWTVVRRAQEAAFRAMRPGVECQDVDRAARAVIEEAGFGREYERFTHRLGHGIGMDGHEWAYLVRGNKTRLQVGMCFSDEPGIYIPGEVGVRHEDIVFVTEDGARNMTKWSGSPEDPAAV